MGQKERRRVGQKGETRKADGKWLAQRKVGPDPFELLDVLAEMNRRTGGDGEPIRRTGYRQPGARSWLEDYYDDWKALRAGSPGESP